MTSDIRKIMKLTTRELPHLVQKRKNYCTVCSLWQFPGRGGGGGGGCARATGAPPKIGSTVFKSIFSIRMLKNKAQIARESNKTTLELPGPCCIKL